MQETTSVATGGGGNGSLETPPAIKRTAKHLKHPSRSELKFNRGENSGVILSIAASDAALNRAPLLGDKLLRATEMLGWTFAEAMTTEPEPGRSNRHHRVADVPPTPIPTHPIGELDVAGERIEFRIEERLREEPRVPTPQELAREKREFGYHAPRKPFIVTSKLRIVRLDIDDVGYQGLR